MSGEATCASCAAAVHPLDLFPGGVCLACHARATDDATPDELLAMIRGGFGAGSIRRERRRR